MVLTKKDKYLIDIAAFDLSIAAQLIRANCPKAGMPMDDEYWDGEDIAERCDKSAKIIKDLLDRQKEST